MVSENSLQTDLIFPHQKHLLQIRFPRHRPNRSSPRMNNGSQQAPPPQPQPQPPPLPSSLGHGAPQWQFYCLECARLREEVPYPATLTEFYHSPTRFCLVHHGPSIRWCVGCDRHRGNLEATGGQCLYCHEERRTGVEIPLPSLRDTSGYPGDQYYNYSGEQYLLTGDEAG